MSSVRAGKALLAVVAIAGPLAALSGCGQKGPLVLPAAAAPASAPGSGNSAGAGADSGVRR